jgi:hypothetical protein
MPAHNAVTAFGSLKLRIIVSMAESPSLNKAENISGNLILNEPRRISRQNAARRRIDKTVNINVLRFHRKNPSDRRLSFTVLC